MITYVNSVFVNSEASSDVINVVPTTYSASNIGKIIFTNKNGNEAPSAEDPTVRIGQITNKSYTDKTGKHHVIKWANTFDATSDIKSITYTAYTADTDETIEIDFTGADAALLAEGGKRIVVRLTFKDLPTRYRKWSESYEYTTIAGDTATTVADAFADIINGEYKRARVTASASAGILTLTAMAYDDDDMIDSISWAEKVRFSANVWYTDPQALGFASKNKYALGVTIEKTPGEWGKGTAKLVRDREAQAMGYMGVLNRGECTWPIIKPDMFVTLDGKYNTLTIEFERSYHSADDLIRRTKECVEIYTVGNAANSINTAINGVLNPTNSASVSE